MYLLRWCFLEIYLPESEIPEYTVCRLGCHFSLKRTHMLWKYFRRLNKWRMVWYRFISICIATSPQLLALSRHSRISTASPKNDYKCCSILVHSHCNILLVLTCLVWVRWITMKNLLSHTLPIMSNLCFASNQRRPMKIWGTDWTLNWHLRQSFSSPVHDYRIV